MSRRKKHTKKWLQYDKWLRRIILSCPKTFRNADILHVFWLMRNVPGIVQWRDPKLADLPETLSEPTINSHMDHFARMRAVEMMNETTGVQTKKDETGPDKTQKTPKTQKMRIPRRYRLVNASLLLDQSKLPERSEKMLRHVDREIEMQLPDLGPILTTNRTGSYNELATRYKGVIISAALNPPARWMFSTLGLEEEFDDPLDQTILDHVLRGMYLEFALERNYAVHKDGYASVIEPARLARGDLSVRDIGRILRSLRFHYQDKVELLFTINLRKLEKFLQTSKGKKRLLRALAFSSREYKAEISKGVQNAFTENLHEIFLKEYSAPTTRMMGKARGDRTKGHGSEESTPMSVR